ncbi:CRISPR-associated endonuclease Cas1 [Oscillatoria salina]|uniref:CRISPR-associated endonuclease Cas1 n=1 Tax=Oscillatoria salina TaxID=331517 RepID=UPI001CCB8E7C|nr:CRISPR-associated endonuclease Cas1 [Oscillatoria salina]MBZ8180534.1 CRISPR-associated endonuclease Cas1 [Oscillatoria salina IIICB1]
MDISLIHLEAAWEIVRQRTQAAGIDGITTDLFSGIVNQELPFLQHQLQQETYLAYPAKGFYLKKKSGGYRLVGIPTVKDRIVQRLLLQSIYPALEETFSNCSFAYRPGNGVKQAIDYFAQFYTAQPVWIIKADIAQFFDNLSWALLLTQLEKISLEPTTLRLIEQQLKSGVIIQQRRLHWIKGVLQGGILSGALANLYLSEFDAKCLDLDIKLVRYGDDFVIATPGLLEATRILHLLRYWLRDIYLTLQPEKTQIFAPHEEFKFLGYRFQAGQIIPPVRKLPQSRTKAKKKTIVPISRPPRTCSLKRHKTVFNPASAKQYWSEAMTTLYVTEQGAYINVKHQQFQVSHNHELKIAIPANRISHIVLFGCCNLSQGAVNLALKRRIPIILLSQKGHYFGRLQAEGMAEIKYLVAQVEHCLEAEFILQQAKSIVEGKLHNSRILLQRLNRRKNNQTESAKEAIAELKQWIKKVPTAESLEVLFGYEGEGARIYWQGYGSLLKEPFVFNKRTRRPPIDPVNSLLSLGYTLIFQNIYSLVQAVGLHPHFGNLHAPQKNHPALISDLMEEFRAPIVDSLVAYLVNGEILTLADFMPPDARGGVYLHPDALKKYLQHWQKMLQKEITHPHTGYKVNYHRCLELQIWEYVACLMGEEEVYRPMKWKK